MPRRLHQISFFALTATLLLAGCRAGATFDKQPRNLEARHWVGVYASPSEIGGFTGTTLAIQWDEDDGPRSASYRMRFRTDVASFNDIPQEEESGLVLIEGDRLYLPRADGEYDEEGVPHLFADVERYTLRRINGHDVLLRDDALAAFERDNELYDYGILIRVDDEADWMTDLKSVEHPSIRVLYSDPDKPWRDPFVHGPNAR